MSSLNEILLGNYWQKIISSWRDEEKMFVECESKCHMDSSCSKFARNLNNNQITYEEFKEVYISDTVDF